MATVVDSFYNDILKDITTQEVVTDIAFPKNPAMAMIPKDETFRGRYFVLPIQYGVTGARSSTAANAFSTAGTGNNGAYTAFYLLRSKEFASAVIDGEVMIASQSDAGAFMPVAEAEIQGGIHAISRAISVKMFRGAFNGSIGQVLAEPTEQVSPVLTVKNAWDILNIEVGQWIGLYNSSATRKLFDTGVYELQVTNVDRDALTFTLAGEYTSNGTIVASDELVPRGDYNVSLKGMQAWIPTTVTATEFYGVDRTSDKQRLAGTYIDQSTKSVSEAIIDTANRIARYGHNPDTVFCSFEQFAALEKDYMAKGVRYENVMVGEIGIESLIIKYSGGKLNVVPDASCPTDQAMILTLKDWVLASAGPLINVDEKDGLLYERVSGEDSIMIRFYSYLQLGCRAPARSGRCKLAVPA